MNKTFRIAIVSDIHYAADEERARCANNEHRKTKNPITNAISLPFHYFIWLRHCEAHNHLLDQFFAAVGQPDLVIANGDFSCNTRGLGVSDDDAFASAEECLNKLRARFGEKFHATIGDHEFGKTGMFTGRGAMNLASWHNAVEKLKIEPFWRMPLEKYVLLGVTSSLIAFPIFKHDALPEEIAEWERLREIHLQKIRAAFANLKPEERVLLFCHDPTALPFLAREPVIREKISQIEQTIIGHLHSKLILRGSDVLSGLPSISFLGKGVKRISAALGEARLWEPFHVRLCPSLTGIQLLKDGGFLTAELDASRPAQFEFHPIRW